MYPKKKFVHSSKALMEFYEFRYEWHATGDFETILPSSICNTNIMGADRIGSSLPLPVCI
jgi:hypothetical protein